VGHKLVFRPAAEADIESLYDYISEHGGVERAGAFIDRIEQTCRNLTTFPERGTVRDDLHTGIRIIGFERRTSIAFIVEDDTVKILRILYGGREFPSDWQAE